MKEIKRKRTWTLRSALGWIDRVEMGLEQWGLKRCSAESYLRRYYGSVPAAREAAMRA